MTWFIDRNDKPIEGSDFCTEVDARLLQARRMAWQSYVFQVPDIAGLAALYGWGWGQLAGPDFGNDTGQLFVNALEPVLDGNDRAKFFDQAKVCLMDIDRWMARRRDKKEAYDLIGSRLSPREGGYGRVVFSLVVYAKKSVYKASRVWSMRYLRADVDPAGPITSGMGVVDQLDAKVWCLRSKGQDQRAAIVKYEFAGAKRTIGGAEAMDFVLRMASDVLDSAPISARLTSDDFAAISQLESGAQFDKKLSALECLINANGDPGMGAFRKMEFVPLGANLAKRALAMKGEFRSYQAKARKALLSDDNCRALGRIAGFDLMVGNRDRFSIVDGKPSLNPKNVDFDTDDRPFPLDNYDPNSSVSLVEPTRQLPNWEGKKGVVTEKGRSDYAQAMVARLWTELLGTDLPPNNLVAEFKAGMEQSCRIFVAMDVWLVNASWTEDSTRLMVEKMRQRIAEMSQSLPTD